MREKGEGKRERRGGDRRMYESVYGGRTLKGRTKVNAEIKRLTLTDQLEELVIRHVLQSEFSFYDNHTM